MGKSHDPSQSVAYNNTAFRPSAPPTTGWKTNRGDKPYSPDPYLVIDNVNEPEITLMAEKEKADVAAFDANQVIAQEDAEVAVAEAMSMLPSAA